MVRRSKRSAKSEPAEQGDAQSEEVTEEVCSVEQALWSMHSGDADGDGENIPKDVTLFPLIDPVENVTNMVGETGDVQGGQSEKETGENKDGMEMGNGSMTSGSGLQDPKAAVDEVMADGDDEVATAIAEAEKALASESEAPHEEQTAVEAADKSASEVVDISADEDMAESDEKEVSEPCLYCDDSGFSVNDVEAYVAHLETEHRVVRNAHLLARNTIDTHRQGMSAG